MKKYFLMIMMLCVVSENSLSAAESSDEDGNKPVAGQNRVPPCKDISVLIGGVQAALDDPYKDSPSGTFIISGTHFFITMAGSHQTFKAWFPVFMDEETAAWAAPAASVVFSGARLFLVSDKPISSVAGTAIIAVFGWLFHSP
tara:strand:+ start:16933 stop:17361 length:429 start_codon:yes stop_codon:yes gene_type:complete